MLQQLSNAESRQLFHQHVFGDKIPSHKFMYLSKEILQHAGGLPLALEVFGSNFRNQSEAEWKRFIGQLEEVVHSDVLEKLMVSFHTLLSPTPKKMFLDISCFFVGDERNDVRILGSCYKDVEPNIDHLMSRCLITFDEYNRFSMHDLLRDIGWEITRQNSPKDESEKHSRLSAWEDICDVLENNKGTEAIIGMVHHYNNEIFDKSCRITFDTETFKRIPKLRFLKMKDVNLTGTFEQTFKDLRWLQWRNCPLKCLSCDFCPKNLVIIELSHSNIGMWEQNKDLKHLKILDLSGSLELLITPDFSRLPCLESINLCSCNKLEKVDTTIGSLVNLVSLDLEYCTRLRSLPDSVCNLRALKSLNITSFYSPEALPEKLGYMESLTKLFMGGLHFSKLPDSVGHLVSLSSNMTALEILDICECKEPEEFDVKITPTGAAEFLKKRKAPVFEASGSGGPRSFEDN